MLGIDYPANVSDLIFRGFLVLRVDVGRHRILLKSINENEAHDVRQLSEVSDDDINQAETEEEKILLVTRRLPYLLAWSTFQVGDHNVLSDRRKSGWFRPLIDFYNTRHPSMVGQLAEATMYLASWYAYEVFNVERFCMQSFTRSMWFSYKVQNLNDPSVTCLEGTQYLGLNQHQILFKMFLNQWEKSKVFEQQWEIAKAQIAGSNYKLFQDLERKDKTRKQQEEVHEREVLEGIVVVQDREKVYADLEEELIQQVSGVKDDFDLRVERKEIDEKWELLLDRMASAMYGLMYGRKLVRRDMVVIGHQRIQNDLPLGQFNMNEAKEVLRSSCEKLNKLGGFLAPIPEMTEDEEEAVIGEAVMDASVWHKELERKKEIQDGRVDSINTNRP